MFWNFFKKQTQEPETQECLTWICYGIDDEGLSIDVNIEDFSEKSLTNFAKLLAGVSTMALVPDTIAIIKEGLKSNEDAYNFVITKSIEYAKEEVQKILEDSELQSLNSDDPVIKPSDIIK